MASYTGEDDVHNFFRLVSLLTDIGASVLRRVLNEQAKKRSGSLMKHLSFHQSEIQTLKKKRILNQSQLDILFPPNGSQADLDECDVTLLSCVIGNTCILSKAQNDELDSLRNMRNEVIAHAPRDTVDEKTFKSLWANVSTVIANIASWSADQNFIKDISDNIQSLWSNPKFLRPSTTVLHQWYHMDEEIKDRLKKVEEGVESVRKKMKTQEGIQKMLEDQQKEHETKLEQTIKVRAETQREELREEISNSEIKLKRTVEERMQTNCETLKGRLSQQMTNMKQMVEESKDTQREEIEGKLLQHKTELKQTIEENFESQRDEIKGKLSSQTIELTKSVEERVKAQRVQINRKLSQQTRKLKQGIKTNFDVQREEVKGKLSQQESKLKQTVEDRVETHREEIRGKLGQETIKLKQTLEKSVATQWDEMRGKLSKQAINLEQTIADRVESQRAEIKGKLANQTAYLEQSMEKRIESQWEETKYKIAQKAKRLKTSFESRAAANQEQTTQYIKTFEERNREEMERRLSEQTETLEERNKVQLEIIKDKLCAKKIRLSEEFDECVQTHKLEVNKELAIQSTSLCSKGQHISNLETKVAEQSDALLSKGQKIKQLQAELSKQNRELSEVTTSKGQTITRLEARITEQDEKIAKILEMYQTSHQQYLHQQTAEINADLHQQTTEVNINYDPSDRIGQGLTKPRKGSRTTDAKLVSTTRTAEAYMSLKARNSYVKTQMVREAENKLNDGGCVIISGKPGEGKTLAGAALLSSSFPETKGMVLKDPEEWNTVDINKTTGIFIDDIFGVSQLEQHRLEQWLNILPEIQAHVDKHNIKVIITTRTNVLKECQDRLKGYSIFNTVVEFASNKLLLTEKVEMLTLLLHRHGKVMNTWAIRKCVNSFTSPIGFPFCCHLFCTDASLFKLGANFFSKPHKFFRDNLENVDKMKYLSLVLMFCYKGEVNFSELTTQNISANLEAVTEDIVQSLAKGQCLMKPKVSQIKTCFEEMSGVYIEKTKTSYTFIHNIIQETIGLLFGSDNPTMAIKLCSTEFLRQCILSREKEYPFETLVVPQQSYPALAERFIQEVMMEEEVRRTAEHPAFQSKEFVSVLIKLLEENGTTEKFFIARQEDKFHSELNFLSELVRTTPKHNTGPIKTILDVITTCSHQMKSNRLNCWRCLLLDEAVTISCTYYKLDIFLELMNFGAFLSPGLVKSIFKVYSDEELWEAIAVLEPGRNWNAISLQTMLEEACECNKAKLIKFLRSKGAKTTNKCVPLTAFNNCPVLLQDTIHQIKSEVAWNPDSGEIVQTLERAYEANSKTVIDILLREGVKATPKCLYFAVAAGDMESTKQALDNLQSNCRIDNSNSVVNDAIERACLMRNDEMVDLLESNNVLITSRCLYVSVMTGEISMVAKILKRLKSLGLFDAYSEDVIASMHKSFKAPNVDMIHLLLSEGAVVTGREVYLATLCGQVPLFQTAVANYLSSTAKSNTDEYIIRSVDTVFKTNHAGMINYLLSKSRLVTHRCTYWAVKKNDMALLNRIFKILDAEKRWKIYNGDSKNAIIYAFQKNNKEVIDFLLTRGMDVAPECISLSVAQREVALVRLSVQNLKSTGRWESDSNEVRNALVECYEMNETEMIHLLRSECVPVTPKCVHFAARNNAGDLLITAIQSLQKNASWNPDEDIYLQTMVDTYREKSTDVSETLLSQGVPLCLECVFLAVVNKEAGTLRRTIKHLKFKDKWQTDNKYVRDALFLAHQEHMNELVGILLSEEVVDVTLPYSSSVATELFVNSVDMADVALMKVAIKSLKLSGKWCINVMHIHTAIENAYNGNNLAIIEELHRDESLFSPACVTWAVINDNIRITTIACQSLMSRGRLLATDPDLNLAIENAFKYRKTKFISILLEAGVSVTPACFYLALGHQSKCLLESVISSMKSFDRWDIFMDKIHKAIKGDDKAIPNYIYLSINAIEHCFEKNIEELLEILLSEGAFVTAKCIYWSVLNKNIPCVESGIANMKSTQTWNPKDRIIYEAFEHAFEKHEGMFELLGAEGVWASYWPLYKAAKQADVTATHTSIRKLKLSSQWNPREKYALRVLEKACEINNKDIIHILLSEGVQVTEGCILWTVMNKDTETLRKMISSLKVPGQMTNSTIAATGIEFAYTMNNKEMVSLLWSLGVQETVMCLLPVVKNKDAASIQRIVRNLKSSGQWNNSDMYVRNALQEAYILNDKQIIYILQNEGAQVTHACLYWALIHGNYSSVHAIIQNLKVTGRWNKDDKCVLWTLEEAYITNRQEILDFVLTEGSRVPDESLFKSVSDGNLASVKAIIQEQNTSGQWNVSLGEVNIALEKAYIMNNKEIINILISEVVGISQRCVFWAVVNKDLNSLRRTILELKSSGHWDVNSTGATEGLENAYRSNSAEIIAALQSEGVQENENCLLPAVTNKCVASVQRIVGGLKSSGQWNNSEICVEKAIEKAYGMKSKEIIDLLLKEGAQVTHRCLYWALYHEDNDSVHAIIQNLKVTGRWDSDDRGVLWALARAHETNQKGMLDVVLTEGKVISNMYLFKAVSDGNLAYIQRIIRDLKSVGQLDYGNKEATFGLEKAYVMNNKEIIDMLLSECVPVSQRCVFWAVVNEDLNFLRRTIEELKTSGHWDVNSTGATEGLEKAYRNNNEEIIAVLQSEGVQENERCLLPAVTNKCVASVQRIIWGLKSSGQWNNIDINVEKSIEKAYRMKNQEIINLLQKEGAQVTHRCLYWALYNEDNDSVHAIIQNLRVTGRWDRDNRSVLWALERAYDTHQEEMLDVVLTEGKAISNMCLFKAVSDGNLASIQSIIRNLKSSGQWDNCKVETTYCLEKAYAMNKKKCIDIFLSEGVQVPQRCVLWAVLNKDLSCLRRAIDGLKSSGLWDKNSTGATEALERAYYTKSKEMVAVLCSERVPETSDCLRHVVESKDVAALKRIISDLKSSGQWHVKNGTVRDAVEEAYKINDTEIINVLHRAGARGTIYT